MTYGFAASFSFPPGNFLTLVGAVVFWVALKMTFMRAFVSDGGVAVCQRDGVALAVNGMVRGPRATRRFSTS